MCKQMNYGLVAVASFFLLAIFQGCDYKNSDYAPFPVDGWGVKYLDANNKPIESKRFAHGYRKAFYRNGKPDKDSLATDYSISGGKKTEGHLLSENPDIYDGEKVTFRLSGEMEKKETFDNGLLIEQRYYFSDGTRSDLTKYHYKNGVIEKYTHYDEIGNKDGEGIYKNGVLYQHIAYYPNGRIKLRQTFEDPDKNTTLFEEYYESGRIKLKARAVKSPNYAKNLTYLFVGDVYSYDEKGRLTITNNAHKPTQSNTTTTRKKSSTWDRGYDYGWDAGYQDGVDGNDMWDSFNDAGKGGDFLDGYTSGYEDGYADGRKEWERYHKDDDD